MEKNSIIDKFEAQKYEEIIAKREMFTDNLFPPSNESINFQIEEETKQSVPKFLDANVQTKPSSKLNYRWFRISKILKEYHLIKKVKSVSEENLVDDVVQGALGDCYYLSALSALAEYKDRIINIFKSKEINEYGCYQIKCYIHGDEVHLVLDDYFPCVGSDNQPQLAFSSVDLKDYNIWPLLLEKAWAKVNKNYDNIICGTAAHAFQFLTPAGIEVYYHSENFYKLYNHIKEADDRKFIICTDISENSNTASTSIITSLGLLTNHAYSIISAHEVTTKTGDIEKLLRIRNPWGKLEWNGDWSDDSEKWTPELKKQLKVEDVDDGTFFMSFKDFLRFFTTSYICKYHDNYFYESIKISYKPNKIFHLISIDFKEKNHGYFILNMKNSKIYKNLKNKKIFKNFFCTFLVYKVEKDNQFKLVGSKSSRLDRKHVEANIDPGTYVVAVHFPKELNKNVIDFQEYEKEMDNFKEKISFRLGFYSMSKGTLFKEIETESNYYSILHSLALQMSNDNKLKEIFFQEGEPETWRCLDFSNEIINGFGFLAYNNMSNATIREKLYLTSFVNIRLIPLINIDNENKLSINSEDVIEDEYEDVLLKTFRKDLLTSNSTVKHELKNSKIKEITEENPLIIEICIAPKSTGVLLIEKFEEFASIKASSEINMVFPFDFIYSEKRFNGKKTRIKYKNDFLNIFENIIKYPTGVMFKYKNKTKEYKIEITIHFESLQNLQFNRSYLKNYLLVQNEYRKLDKRTDDEKMEEIVSFDEENQRVKITLYPSHSAFIELISINQFIDYSFKSNIDYKICLSEFYFSSKIK